MNSEMQQVEWETVNIREIPCPKCGVTGMLTHFGMDYRRKYHRVFCGNCKKTSSELQLMHPAQTTPRPAASSNYTVNKRLDWLEETLGQLLRFIRLLEVDVRTAQTTKTTSEPNRRDRGKVCSGCGAEGVVLVKHHWWLPGETQINKARHTKMICVRCNHLPSLANGTHILPSWEEQLVMIARDYREELEILHDDLSARDS